MRNSSEPNLQIIGEKRKRFISAESCFELNISSSYSTAGTQPYGGEKGFSQPPLTFPCVQVKALFAQAAFRAP